MESSNWSSPTTDSTDNTMDVVEAFRRRVNFPVKFVTHPRLGFQASRCRNEGAAATSAPYLLFLDGDCVLPPHHVAAHLAHRRPGAALIGDVCKLAQSDSQRMTEETIRRGNFSIFNNARERRRLRLLDLKYRLYNFIRHPKKPRSLRSGDFSIWRDDYRRVNGFDENFCGWGGEDDDLGRRLRRAGVRLQSLLALDLFVSRVASHRDFQARCPKNLPQCSVSEPQGQTHPLPQRPDQAHLGRSGMAHCRQCRTTTGSQSLACRPHSPHHCPRKCRRIAQVDGQCVCPARSGIPVPARRRNLQRRRRMQRAGGAKRFSARARIGLCCRRGCGAARSVRCARRAAVPPRSVGSGT